jgi:PAT family beta-lactamase induction signal transducer AmpG
MAAAMIVGLTTSFWAPEPQLSVKPPTRLRDATALPLQEFFSRTGAWEVLIFLILYRIDYNLIWTMTTPFIMAIGFTKTDIGVVTKGFGIIATIVGGLIGGGLILRLGIWRSLIIFGVAQAASSVSYIVLAHVGHYYPMMVTAIVVENVCGGMASSAMGAFMMSLCDKRFTATQFALISSFMGLSRYAAGAPSGYLAKHMGWQSFFLLAAFAGIPALLMLLRYRRWSQPFSSPVPEASPA